MTIYVYLPIDKNTKSPDYFSPTIENTKDSLLAAISVLPPVAEDEDNNNHYYGGGNNDPFEGVLKEVHKEWIEVMSYSHNVANQCDSEAGSAHFGEFTMTKFICSLSPVLNYFCLKNEFIPKVIFRAQTTKKKGILSVLEYEFEAVAITNQSVSGGAGGKPVETISLKPTTVMHKMYEIDLASGEYITQRKMSFNVSSNLGSRSIVNQDKVIDDIAKDHVLDDNEPEKVKLLKEMGLVSAHQHKFTNSFNYYRILASFDPPLYKKIAIPSPKTRAGLIENTAKAIGKKASDIEAIYDSGILVEIECDEDLKDLNSLSSVFVKVDGKYIGIESKPEVAPEVAPVAAAEPEVAAN
ncbi:hypothetical protein DFA_05787 [Cavenderia fasciculata]|uniref:Uncharacterized protein n=1 Tax=Cavenderia fasciculata TaxID=261658 RepID=F4PMK6_CACFS|nr:uncharacterized protein DFA_05787 [Cavenderia fasciculata]EGG23653.1 hypothetical protein DFA_05787 [Cavenderia fasciculata]|eukprot:XP_004361504.1 hypothetical protein DFA_05787 [Cavenderia fasciculata]